MMNVRANRGTHHEPNHPEHTLTNNKLLANRRNALRSSGPSTPAGRGRSAQNALRHGFYTAAVVPAAGESVDEFEALRARVRDELNPEGELGERLAERVALILWRFDRVMRYEAAVAAQGVGALATGPLPPDPDAITGAGADIFRGLPPDAPPALRLAFARGWLADRRATRRHLLGTAAALGLPAGAGTPPEPPDWLGLRLFADAVGWDRTAVEEKWDRFASAPGAGPLVGAALEGALAELARAAGKDPGEVLATVRVQVAARIAHLDGLIAGHEREEAELVTRMRAARAAALAAGVYADGDAVERVLRAEAHLTRQLGFTLDLLDRLRGGTDPADPAVRLRRLVAGG